MLSLALPARTRTSSSVDIDEGSPSCVTAVDCAVNSLPCKPSTSPAPLSPVTVAVHGVIGQGGHGKVVKATMSGVGLVALKQLPISDPQTRRELEVVCKLRSAPHSNIITTYSPLGAGDSVYLPLELADSDLFAKVERNGPLSESAAKAVFGPIASALAHCHAQGVYHGDVKPENILLVGDKPVLTDFGSATFNRASLRPCSTVLYGSPEAVAVLQSLQDDGSKSSKSVEEAAKYDMAQSDVWSLGISIVASVSGFMPWETAYLADRRFHYWAHAVAHSADGFPLDVAARLMFGEEASTRSKALLHLLAGMLHPNPARRFTLSQVLSHPWFAMP